MRMALRLCSSRMLYFTLAPKTGMSVNKTHELSHNLLLQTHSPHFSPSPSISAPLSMFRSIETRACVLPCPTALTNAACSQMSRQRTQLHTTALGDASGLSASASLARSMRRLVTTSGVPCASVSSSVAGLSSLPSFLALSCPGVAACCVAHLLISVCVHAPRLRLAIYGVWRAWAHSRVTSRASVCRASKPALCLAGPQLQSCKPCVCVHSWVAPHPSVRRSQIRPTWIPPSSSLSSSSSVLARGST